MSEYLILNVANADRVIGPLPARVFVTTGNTNRQITLPDAAVPRKSRVITIKKVDSGTGVVNIVCLNGQTIDGQTLYSLNKQFQSVVLTPDGSNWQIAACLGDDEVGANGESMQIQQATELLTLAAAATTDTTANLLPANSVILGVTVRVVTIIPTAATFSVGDATTAARFGSGIAVAAGTTNNSFDAWNSANTNAQGPVQGAAAKVRITPNLSPGAATGQVRITVYYLSMTPASR